MCINRGLPPLPNASWVNPYLPMQTVLKHLVNASSLLVGSSRLFKIMFYSLFLDDRWLSPQAISRMLAGSPHVSQCRWRRTRLTLSSSCPRGSARPGAKNAPPHGSKTVRPRSPFPQRGQFLRWKCHPRVLCAANCSQSLPRRLLLIQSQEGRCDQAPKSSLTHRCALGRDLLRLEMNSNSLCGVLQIVSSYWFNVLRVLPLRLAFVCRQNAAV